MRSVLLACTAVLAVAGALLVPAAAAADPTEITNVAAPTISGTPRVGATLRATPGDWDPAEVNLSYRWLRDGEPIAAAGTATYALVPADLGAAIRVRVTATWGDLDAVTVTSGRTAAVGKGRLRMLTRPRIEGRPKVGRRLVARPGRWSPAPARVKYVWYAGGKKLRHHIGKRRLRLTGAMRGKRISVVFRYRAPRGYADLVRTRKKQRRVYPLARPVRLPRAAPAPRRTLPKQRRAVGKGAHPVITRVPDGVWRSMVGVSWHRGCPVGRPGLRLLRINYWDFGGHRRRGEVVAARGAVGKMAGALRAMYRKRLPIRAMYRVDRFGWSRRLGGGNDYASMAADNTSAFNCRDVVGRPGVRSPHAYGRSLDVNPWENPYRSSQGWHPNRWWVSRSHGRVAWRSRSHAVVRVMRNHGLRWTYGRRDAHHFDAAVRHGREVPVPDCGMPVCH
jgi:hypothetical protein